MSINNTDLIQLANSLLQNYSKKKLKSSDLLACISNRLLYKVARIIGADSIRVYIFSFRKGVVKEKTILGDSTLWKNFNINNFNFKNSFFQNDYSFFKISDINHNGKIIDFGYLGILKKNITEYEVSYMTLLGHILGNILSGIIVRHHIDNSERRITNTIIKLTDNKLPGTALVIVMRAFCSLSSFTNIYYFSIDDKNWYLDYICNQGQRVYTSPIYIINTGLNDIIKQLTLTDCYLEIDGIEIPMTLQDVVFYKKKSVIDNFVCQFYPIKNDGVIIGVWVAINLKRNVEFYNGESFLRSIYPLMRLNYNYIYQRRSKKMIINPMFADRDTRINEKEVFVIMPFSRKWSNGVWKRMIMPVVESMGLTPLRADNLYGANIMEDIWKGILHSSLVIADITSRNPNVLYELGIAHTLGKKVILITQDEDDIPFDLKHLRHILYKYDVEEAEEFKTTLRKYINEQLDLCAN